MPSIPPSRAFPVEQSRAEYRERTGLARRIVFSYPWTMRLYSLIRFLIVRARILGVMDVLLPERGRILELGCGLGLFAGYFACTGRNRQVFGVDRNERRIRMAKNMAKRMDCGAQFTAADIRSLPPSDTFDAIYALDVMHHIPYEAHLGVLHAIHDRLGPGGLLLVKDITTFPPFKLWFTWVLDRLMAPGDELSYRHHAEWQELLGHAGFDVRVRHLDDYLPYPHVLFICRKRGSPVPQA